MEGLPSKPSRFGDWLENRSDDAVLVWLLRGLLAATALVLLADLAQFAGYPPALAPVTVVDRPGTDARQDVTVARPFAPARRGRERRALRRPDVQLAAAMSFELSDDGRLWAIGTIKPGTAQAFAAQIERRGSSVKTVVLHSPGGSVGEAIEMGRLIRQKKLTTEVMDGRYCASSCPLVFAGGAVRRAGERAAIGVHQVVTLAREGDALADSMDSVQRVSAECQKYLREMGVDPMLWTYAMETPPEELFFFRPDELLTLKLATVRASQRGTASARAKS